MVKFFKIRCLAQNSSLGLVEDARSQKLVKSGNICLKTGPKRGVSEIMDVEKTLVLYASEPYNRPCAIA